MKLHTKVIKPSKEQRGKKVVDIQRQLGEIIFGAKPEVTEKRAAFAVFSFFFWSTFLRSTDVSTLHFMTFCPFLLTCTKCELVISRGANQTTGYPP